jgi:hypothetical protein
MTATEIQAVHARFAQEGTRLAGGLTDLAQRAAVYHHVFHDSGRNHVFPLIAAHGALWARGYFGFGLRLAWWLSWQYAFDAASRRQRLAAVAAFANVLRDINRRVCADTYASYHFTALYGRHDEAEKIIAPSLLDALNCVHDARRAGIELSDQQKRAVFQAHFLNEQEFVVGPTIAQATANLQWPLIRFIALKPLIRFAYFPGRERMWFNDFSNRDERITNGLQAFEFAARAGWRETETALRHYGVLPDEFFVDCDRHFDKLRGAILAGA